MAAWWRRELGELREGFRILGSRDFWRAFRDYWSAPKIAARMDAFTERLRNRY